jgi:hypothetical protein
MGMRELTSTSEVFDELGGLTAVAELVGLEDTKPGGRGYKAASNWKSSRAFPSRVYLVMTAALAERGFIASPSLWGMVAPEPAKEAAE